MVSSLKNSDNKNPCAAPLHGLFAFNYSGLINHGLSAAALARLAGALPAFGIIAAVLGVTESRVCQLHSQSIARLRAKMRAH